MNRKTLMIVVQEALQAEELARQAHALGWTVTGITTEGSAAKELFRQTAPKLILLDIDLDGDGVVLAREIRDLGEAAFIFLLSEGDGAGLERAASVDPLGFIVSPLGPLSLQAVLLPAWRHYRALLRFRLLHRYAPSGVLLFRHVADEGTYRLIHRNSAAEVLDGPLPSETPTFEEYFRDIDYRELRQLFDDVLLRGENRSCTVILRRRSHLFCWRHYSLLLFPEGEITAVFRDDTAAQRQKEEAQRRIHDLTAAIGRQEALASAATVLLDGKTPLEKRLRLCLEGLLAVLRRERPEAGFLLRWTGGDLAVGETAKTVALPFHFRTPNSSAAELIAFCSPQGDEDPSCCTLSYDQTEFIRRGMALIAGTLRHEEEQRRASDAIALLESALNDLALPIVLADREGMICYVNDSFEVCTGLFKEELHLLPLQALAQRMSPSATTERPLGRPENPLGHRLEITDDGERGAPS